MTKLLIILQIIYLDNDFQNFKVLKIKIYLINENC